MRVPLLPLRALTRLVLNILLSLAGREGLCWITPRKIAGMLPRNADGSTVHVKTVLRALSELASAGLLTWTVLLPWKRWPWRDKSTGKVHLGHGVVAPHGGRIWSLDLAAIRRMPTIGMESGGRDTGVLAGRDTSVPATDLGSSSKNLNTIPPLAPPARASTQTPAGSRVASETPTRALAGAGAAPTGGENPRREAGSKGEQPTRHTPTSAQQWATRGSVVSIHGGRQLELVEPCDSRPRDERPPEPSAYAVRSEEQRAVDLAGVEAMRQAMERVLTHRCPGCGLVGPHRCREARMLASDGIPGVTGHSYVKRE